MKIQAIVSVEADSVGQAKRLLMQRHKLPLSDILILKPSEEQRDMSNFTNLGTDEAGQLIGNCVKCGQRGVIVMQHICPGGKS